VKIVRAVLKGLGGSDAARLPGFFGFFSKFDQAALGG